MPPLSPEQYAALREDIEKHGVRVPVVKDQFGRVIDGNNRMAIALELGIDVPVETVVVKDDDDALDTALTLNCARRHLTQEQRRTLIRVELRRRSGDSDRAIARRVGCSPTTVGTVRAEVRAEAHTRAEEIRQEMRRAATGYFKAAKDLLLLGADLTTVLERAAAAKAEAAAEVKALGEDALTDPLILVKFYVFTTLSNDLHDVASELPEGWRCPRTTSPERLEQLMGDIFRVSNLDTLGGAR